VPKDFSRYVMLDISVDRNYSHQVTAHAEQYFVYGLLSSVVILVRTTGSGCTRRLSKITHRHIGSMGIRRLTAGGVVESRIRMFIAFATRLKVSKTNRAPTTTHSRAKYLPVSSKYAVVADCLLQINADCFKQVPN